MSGRWKGGAWVLVCVSPTISGRWRGTHTPHIIHMAGPYYTRRTGTHTGDRHAAPRRLLHALSAAARGGVAVAL